MGQGARSKEHGAWGMGCPPGDRTEREKSAWQADLAKVPDCSGGESRIAGGHGGFEDLRMCQWN